MNDHDIELLGQKFRWPKTVHSSVSLTLCVLIIVSGAVYATVNVSDHKAELILGGFKEKAVGTQSEIIAEYENKISKLKDIHKAEIELANVAYKQKTPIGPQYFWDNKSLEYKPTTGKGSKELEALIDEFNSSEPKIDKLRESLLKLNIKDIEARM